MLWPSLFSTDFSVKLIRCRGFSNPPFCYNLNGLPGKQIQSTFYKCNTVQSSILEFRILWFFSGVTPVALRASPVFLRLPNNPRFPSIVFSTTPEGECSKLDD